MTQWRVLVPIGIALALWAVITIRPTVSGDFFLSTAASRPCRPTAGERAATEVAITSYPPQVSTPTPVPYPIVTTELAIIASGQDIPLLLPSLVIRSPVDQRPELKALLGTSISEQQGGLPWPDGRSMDNSVYAAQLAEILINTDDSTDPSDFGVLSENRFAELTDFWEPRNPLVIHEPPIAGVGANGTLTVVIPQPERLLANPIAEKVLGRSGERMYTSSDTELIPGGWTVLASGRDITARFDGHVDATTAWDVSVCTAGLPIDSVRLLSTPTAEAEVALVPAPPSVATPASMATPGAVDGHSVPSGNAVATPIHRSQKPTGVHWWFPPTAEPAMIEVSAKAPLLMALRIWSVTGSRRLYVTAIAYMIPAALLLASLLLVPRMASPTADFASARARLVSGTWAFARLTIAALVTLVLVPLYFLSGFVFRLADIVGEFDKAVYVGAVALVIVLMGFLDFPRSAAWTSRRLRSEIALGLITIFAVCWCLVSIVDGTTVPSFATYTLIDPAILVAANSMLLATAARVWQQRNEPTAGTRTVMALPAIGALSLLFCVVLRWMIFFGQGINIDRPYIWRTVGQVIIPFWITFCLTVSIVLLVAALLSSAALRPEGHRPLPRLGRPAVACIAVAVALVVLGQWAWASFGETTVWFRAAVEANVLPNLDSASQEVLSNLSEFPLSSFIAALEFPIILGLAGFVGVFAAAGHDRQTPFLRADQRWLQRTLGILFAAFVISYGGGVLGVQAPLAFVIGLGLLRLAWSDRLAVASGEIDERHGGAREHPLIVNLRGKLLHQAIVLADIEQKRAKARRQLDDGTVEAEEYLQTIGNLEARADLVRRGSSAADDTVDPGTVQTGASRARFELSPDDVPAELALAVGPEKGWWDNGVLALRLGALLAVVPIAYFMFVFLSSRGGADWALTSPFAITGFAAALLYETAFWLVAAMVLGCLFPYLYGPNGAVKGTVLAAVYVGANALAALIGIPGNALWQVRAFQLLLFLMLLGTWLNLKTVEAHGLRWRDLMALYDLPKRTTILSQALPLVTAIAGVVLQLLLGQTQQATENLVSGDTSKAILDFFRGQ